MSTIVLKFNKPAVAALGANSRLRVKSMTRGGKEYVALRPSYRVSGKNAMVRVENNDEQVIAEIVEEMATSLSLPALKSGHDYEFADVGYGWFILKDLEDGAKASTPTVAVSKRKASAKKAEDQGAKAEPAADDQAEQQAAEAEASTTGTNEETASATTEPQAEAANADTTSASTDALTALADMPVSTGAAVPTTEQTESTAEQPESTGETAESKADDGAVVAGGNTTQVWPFKTVAQTEAEQGKATKPKATSKASVKPKASKSAEPADDKQEAAQ